MPSRPYDYLYNILFYVWDDISTKHVRYLSYAPTSQKKVAQKNNPTIRPITLPILSQQFKFVKGRAIYRIETWVPIDPPLHNVPV